MSRLAVAWLNATLWALVALLRAIQLHLTASAVLCAIGVTIAALMVVSTWRADR